MACCFGLCGLIVSIFGYASLTFFLWRLLRLLYVHFLRAKVSMKTYGAGSGYWAGNVYIVVFVLSTFFYHFHKRFTVVGLLNKDIFSEN